MATKTKTKAAERDETEAAPEQQADGPLLDLTDQSVRKMIKAAKKRGYVTYDQLNDVLPSEEFSSEQIEDVLGSWAAPFRRWCTCQRAAASAAFGTAIHSFIVYLDSSDVYPSLAQPLRSRP